MGDLLGASNRSFHVAPFATCLEQTRHQRHGDTDEVEGRDD
jgi:hypothetical protein